MPRLVLVVDDEPDLQRLLRRGFEQAGLDVVSALDGETALRVVKEEAFDVVLLDLMLPDMPGADVCRQLKQDPLTSAIPVVIVTAKGDEVDRVGGFELGADDYVVKPFSVRELILRVRAVLRRVERAVETEDRFTFGKLEVDRAARLAWVEGEEVVLTALGLRLLVMLHEQRGRVLGRDLLRDEVLGGRADMTARNVDNHVRRLRKKLGAAGAYIETVRGVGYRFHAEPTDEGRQ